MTNKHWLKRLTQLASNLAAGQAYLLSLPTDIIYYTGFPFLVPEEREALLIVLPNQFHLLQTSFSPFNPPPYIEDHRGCYPIDLVNLVKKLGIKEILVDINSLFVAEYQTLEEVTGLQIKKLDRDIIWQQRMVKDKDEIELLREAGLVASKTWEEIETAFVAGVTELEIKRLLNKKMEELGSQKQAFPTIVAFGEHGALPHHQPGDTKLKKGQAVLVDFGATVDGYRSDMTRSFWYGDKPSKKFLEIEKVVKKAYKAGLKKLTEAQKSSVRAKDLDTATREVIREAGYGPNFIHTTGHGVGLDIHEFPSLNWKNEIKLGQGVVVTIEPGIYLEGEFGYRYENTVVLTKQDVETLT